MRERSVFHSRFVRFALGAGGGVLYAASLPPISAWPLAWIALAPLCLACVGASPRTGAALGLCFGLTAAVFTSPWFPTMIGDYFEADAVFVWPLAILGWTLCGAAYHACLGFWIAWATRFGTLSPIVIGAGWWLIEWARSHGTVANPWALLAYSQIGYLPLAQSADTLGPYGLGALLATVGAAFAGLLLPGSIGRSALRNGWTIVLLVLASLLYGSHRVAEELEDDSSSAALVQGAMAPVLRSDPSDRDARLAHHLALTSGLRNEAVDLVLWPELTLDFYLEYEPDLQRSLFEGLHTLEVDLITGGYGIDAPRTRATNSVYLVTRDGIRSRYDKNRLMAFSEANPLPFDLFLSDAMTPGESIRLLRRAQVAYGVAICSEAMFPDHVRELVLAGAQVILAPSVDRWFASRGGRRQQLEAVAMRAIESRRFVLRPTESGISAAVDPYGRVVAEAAVDQPAAFIASYSARDTTTLYTLVGDLGVLVAFGVLLFDATRRRLSPSADLGESGDSRGMSPGEDQAAARPAANRSA